MTDNAEKLYLSKLTVPSGANGAAQTYDLKDAEARDAITALENATADGVHFIGKVADNAGIKDGSTTNPITINDKSVTAKAGDLIVQGEEEFVYDGSKWLKFGDLGALGRLAFADSVSTEYTPQGSVTAYWNPDANQAITVTGTPSGSVSVSTAAPTGSESANYTPAGSVSATFSGSEAQEISVTGTPAGSVTISQIENPSNDQKNYTPAGEVTATFTGTENQAISVSGTPAGSVTISAAADPTAGEVNYTPAGTCSAPTVSLSVSGSTDTVYSITDVGTLPSLTTSVADETLTISFSQGTLPCKGAAQTVKTGDASYTAAAPIFSGAGAGLQAAFSGESLTSSGVFTPSGSVNASFTGTAAGLAASFDGSTLTATGSFTPSGSISASFSGTGTVIKAAFEGAQLESAGTFTPSGSVTASFSGTQATITVTGPTAGA